MSDPRPFSHIWKCLLLLLRAVWPLACMALPACQATPKAEPTLAVNPPVLPAEEQKAPQSTEAVAQRVPAPYQTADKAAITQAEPAHELEMPVRPPPRIVVEPANPKVQSISYQSKTNGLVQALEQYLERHNDEASSIIKRYPVDDQEFLLVVVPMLARIELGEIWSTLSPAQRLASLESLRDLVRRRSKSAPLVLQKVMFLDHIEHGRTPQFGEVKARPNNVFRPGDLVILYYEILNLVDHLGEDDLYSVKLNVQVQLCCPDGRTEFGDTKEFKRPGSVSPRTDFSFPASFTLPLTASPGNYQLNLFVTDVETGRQAKATLPLQLVERPARPARKN